MILRTEERPHYTMYRVNGPAIIAHCTQRIFLNTINGWTDKKIKKEIINMAKMSSINKNNRRIRLSDKFYKKRK